MKVLSRFIAEGRVDEDIIPLLELINSREDSFTTSSCAGRIGLMELPELGDKRRAVFHGKWHRRVGREEFREAMGKYEGKLLYLLAQPPIFHIYCRTLEEAREIVLLGREAGFKDSAFRSAEPPYLVALVTTEHLNVPLAAGGTVFPDEAYVDFMVERANAAFERAQGKLERLEEALRSRARR